jgi:hypothetical protein
MTKEELLDQLNLQATELSVEPVTLRQLNDWIDEGLLKTAKAIGVRRGVRPHWDMPEDNLKLGKLILQSVSRGSIRINQHRLFLWVHDCEFPHDIIRNALGLEFGRFVKRQDRLNPSKFDHTKPATEETRQRFEQRLPNVDPLLANIGLDLPRGPMLQSISEMLFGGRNNSNADSIFQHVASLLNLNSEQFPGQIFQMLNLEGQFGFADEIEQSGIEILKNATEVDLLKGRANFKNLIDVLTFLHELFGGSEDIRKTFLAILNSMLAPDWLISTLSSTIVAASKSRLANAEITPKES